VLGLSIRSEIAASHLSITTNQAAITALFRVMNRYVGNLPPMTKQSRSEACGAFVARDVQ